MRVENQNELVVFEEFIRHYGQVFQTECIERGSDCSNFIELLLDEAAGEKMKRFRPASPLK